MLAGKKILNILKGNALPLIMLFAIFFGAGLGAIVKRYHTFSARELMEIGLLGDLFLRLLKGVGIPLLIACVLESFARLDIKVAELYGVRLFLFFIASKFVGITIGFIIAEVIRPGVMKGEHMTVSTIVQGPHLIKETSDHFLEIFYNIFADNLFDMTYKTTSTNITDSTNWRLRFQILKLDGLNMLGIVNFAIVGGIVLKVMGSKNEGIMSIVSIFVEVCFNIVNFIMYISPLLIMSLVCAQVIEADMRAFLTSVGKYAGCAILGMLLIFLVYFPLVIFIAGRKNPFKIYWGYFEGIITGFATSSSLATMPVAIQILLKMGYDEELVSFVTPLFLSVNKDGLCVTYVLVAIFFAQYQRISLHWQDYVLIALFGITLPTATPGVPNASLMMMVVILESIGLPSDYVGSIVALDLIVDRIATAVHATACVVAVCVLSQRSPRKSAEEEAIENNADVVNSDPEPI